MESKTVCFHHNDADGKMSAAIVAQNYPDCEFIECKYGIDISGEDFKDKDVFIVDFSFEKVIMEMIISHAKSLTWIDHHETAKEKYPKLWNDENIKGLRQIGSCGALLTWGFFNTGDAPLSVLLVNDYDLWLHKMGEQTHWLAERVSTWGVDMFKVLLMNDKRQVNSHLKEGKILFEAKKARCEMAIERGKDCIFEGYKAFIVNCDPIDASLIGSMINDKGYKIAIGYYVDGDLLSYSLRSRGELDVSKIAESFGGGGHKNAAGFKKIFDMNILFKRSEE